MTYEVTIELTTFIPLIIEAASEAEAQEVAERLLQHDLSATPEAVGDPVPQSPRIRSVKKREV